MLGFRGAKDCGKAFFIDGSDRGCRESEGDKSALLCVPNPLLLEVGEKAPVGAAGDFKTDPFFLLGNPAKGIASAEARFFSCDFTNFGHMNSFESKQHSKKETSTQLKKSRIYYSFTWYSILYPSPSLCPVSNRRLFPGILSSKMAEAKRLTTSCWMRRLRGLAPKAGS